MLQAFYRDYETDEPEDLHSLIQDATAPEIRAKLRKDPWSVHRHNENGLLPMHLLVQRDGDDLNGLIDVFLSYHADVNGKTVIEGDTPLHVLFKNVPALRALPTAKKLLSCGADPKLRNKAKRSSVDFAMQKGNQELIEVVQSQQWQREPRAIITAVRKGTLDDIKKVIRLGGDVNLRTERGYVPIHYVITDRLKQDKTAVIEILLEHKANINSQTDDKDTAIHLAIRELPDDNELYILVAYMLELEGDPSIKNKRGQLPIDIAKEKRYRDIFDLLRGRVDGDLKADLYRCVEERDTQGLQEILAQDESAALMFNELGLHALHLISMQQGNPQLDMIDILIQAGSKVDCQTLKFNLTPLHLAAEHNNPEVIKRLLKYNADPEQRDHKGKTAYELAADKEYFECMEAFERFFENRERKRTGRPSIQEEKEPEPLEEEGPKKKSGTCSIL